MMSWASKHLTHAARKAEPPVYTEVQLERLGYSPIGMGGLCLQLLLLFAGLVPVAWARLVLGDANYAQALVGIVEGTVVGVAFHMAFTARIRARNGALGQHVQQCLLIPVLSLFGHGRDDLDDLQAVELPFVRGFTEKEQATADELEALHRDHRERLQAERQDYERRLQELRDHLPSELTKRRSLWRLVGSSEEKQQEPEAVFSISRLPGLEFLAVSQETIFRICAEKEHELECLELTNETLSESVRAANDDLMNQQAMLTFQRQESEQAACELQEQLKQRQLAHAEAIMKAAQDLEKAHLEAAERESEMEKLKVEAMERRAEMIRELDRKREEHARALERIRMESDEAQRQQRAELERKQREHAEALERAGHDLEAARRESAAQLEREKRRQGAFVAQLISFAQALTSMLDAGKAGDRKALEKEYRNVRDLKDKMQEEAIRMLAEPILDQAAQTLAEWTRRLQDLRDALDKAKNYSGFDVDKLTQCARLLFSAVAAASDKGLRIIKHDAQLCEEAEYWFFEKWLTSTAKHHADPDAGTEVMNLQKRIVHKAVFATRDDLGGFDFADLEACLETVDCAQKAFLNSAQAQVEHNPPRSLVRALSQLSALVYFLNFLEREDLGKTKEVFKAYLTRMDGPRGEEVCKWVEHVSRSYNEHSVLLRPEDLRGIKDRKPAEVIDMMSRRKCRELGKFHEIFCKLARSWEQDFKVLAVPHHSQVFALLVFKAFLEDQQAAVRTLLGQVSTGEGKSMLIAALAVFACASMGKRVHVVGSDKKLVLRDFENFRALFHAFAPEVAPDLPPERFAVVCADPQQHATTPDVVQSIPDEAWIVYCEAKHVTSLYAQKARQGALRSGMYDNHMLILDEVDALVVDQEPTQDFVYDVAWRPLERGMSIGEYVTQLGRHFARGQWFPEDLMPSSPTEQQLHAQMTRLFRDVEDWHAKPKVERDAEFQIFAGDSPELGASGVYVHMASGKMDPHFNSNFLECLRLNENPDDTGYRMKWYEKLFVMSKPRVFRQYSRILGLSGTIGNEREQAFLRSAYGAQFFIVPPFLETCSGVEVNKAQWARQETAVVQGKPRKVTLHGSLPGPGVVLATAEDQYRAVEALAFEVRRLVPVLIIAPSPESADAIVDRLRQRARSILAGCNTSDLVRSLSQREYDRSPAVYKDNLRASTRTLSRNSTGPKEFRITVTDHTGARGTDYQMVDEDADRLGGLLLIMMHVPPSKRDWIQYKGRTARQNWRGQYCVVLNAQDYTALDQGRQEALPDKAYHLRPGDPPFAPQDPEAQLVQRILDFGSKESERRLEKCSAVYNAGFIANEVCEQVWMHPGWKEQRVQASGKIQVDITLEGDGRKAFLDMCLRYRYMSAEEIVQAAQQIEGPAGAPGRLSFELQNSQIPDRSYEKLPLPLGLMKSRKAVLFLIDVSGSMSTHRIGPTLTRLEACKARIKSLVTNERVVCDGDHVGIVAFGAGYRRLLPRTGRAGSLTLPTASSVRSGAQTPSSPGMRRVPSHKSDSSLGSPMMASTATQRSDPSPITRGGECFAPAGDIVGPVNRRDVTMLVEQQELEAAQVSTLKEYGSDLQVFERNGADIKRKKLGNFTFLYSALHTCASELMAARYCHLSRWLILLCDGDDSGGGRSDASCRELLRSCGRNMNLVIISVGSDVTSGSVLQSFADTTKECGGVGKYLAAAHEEDERDLQNAFAQVEESLLFGDGGQTEVGAV